MVDHFTAIISCHFSLSDDSKPDSCTLVVNITRSESQFSLYFDATQPVNFDYTKYDTLALYTRGCVFTNDKNSDESAYFYFFNNDNDYRRFIFILAESGMIIPQTKSEKYTFCKKHSFIPEGKYNFVHPSISVNIKKILKNRVKKFKTNGFFPFNKDYYKDVFSFLRNIEEKKIRKLKGENEIKMSDSIPSPNQLTLIKKIISRSGYNKQEYNQLRKEMLINQHNRKYLKYFKMIEYDCQQMNNLISNEFLSSIYPEKWSQQLSSMCINICKVYIVSKNAEYHKNNFFIVIKIALLLIGGERIKNFVECSFASDSKREMSSISKSIPSNVKKISESESDFEGLIYFIFSFLMKPLTTNVSELLKNSYNYFLISLESLIPYTIAHFYLKKVDSLNFIQKDVNELFLFTFKSNWIVWFFISRTNDPELAIESIIASIVYFMVPHLVALNIKIDDFWPNFAKNLQNDANLVKSIIDTATCFYFYHKAEVSGSSLL